MRSWRCLRMRTRPPCVAPGAASYSATIPIDIRTIHRHRPGSSLSSAPLPFFPTPGSVRGSMPSGRHIWRALPRPPPRSRRRLPPSLSGSGGMTCAIPVALSKRYPKPTGHRLCCACLWLLCSVTPTIKWACVWPGRVLPVLANALVARFAWAPASVSFRHVGRSRCLQERLMDPFCVWPAKATRGRVLVHRVMSWWRSFGPVAASGDGVMACWSVGYASRWSNCKRAPVYAFALLMDNGGGLICPQVRVMPGWCAWRAWGCLKVLASVAQLSLSVIPPAGQWLTRFVTHSFSCSTGHAPSV